METIAIMNLGAGCGKSLTAYALSRILTERGFKVLAVDADHQATLSLMSNVDEEKQWAASISFLSGGKAAAIYSLAITSAGFPVIHCDANAYEIYLRNEIEERTALKSVLMRYQEDFDYCIIDAPPCVGIWAENILMASDKVIVPEHVPIPFFRAGHLDLFKRTVDAVRANGNPGLVLEGVLYTMADGDPKRLPQLKKTASNIAVKVFRRKIRYDENLGPLASDYMGDYAFSPDSRVGADYRAFANEFFPSSVPQGNPLP